MATLLVQPSSILGDGSLRGIATSNQLDVDYFLFVTCSPLVSSPTESIISPRRFQLILPYQDRQLDLDEILSFFKGIDRSSLSHVVLRNYLEINNLFVSDKMDRATLHY